MSWRAYSSIVGMSCRDFMHESKLSICAVIGIAAVLTPLLVLFGLKFGIVSSLLQTLAQDPRARALQPIGQGQYADSFFKTLGARPEVGFLLPNTRFLAATVILSNNEGDRSLNAEFLPSGPGDPLLPPGVAWPDAAGSAAEPEPVLLSQSASEKLAAPAGTLLDGRLGRTRDNNPENVHVALKVIGVLPVNRFERDGILVRLPFLIAAEDYREGIAVPAYGWEGGPRADTPRTFASFRLYATSIDQVEALRSVLASQGIDAVTELGQIQFIQRLDKDLTSLFLIIAGLGSLGYLLVMTVSFWASVVRKQRELSLLRLIGYSTGAIALFPIVQAVLSAFLGAFLAIGVSIAVAPFVNRMFKGEVPGEEIFRLLPEHLAAALALTVGCAVLAASWGGARAARIAPGEGLREE